jgi:hypothetical protein
MEGEEAGSLAGVSLGAALDEALAAKRSDGGDVAADAESERLLSWHYANLEYGCSAPLSDVSLLHWNQDEQYGGFGGGHAMVKGGYSQVNHPLSLPRHSISAMSHLHHPSTQTRIIFCVKTCITLVCSRVTPGYARRLGGLIWGEWG